MVGQHFSILGCVKMIQKGYGRQRRQRQVTELLAKELLSLSSLFQYQELMSIVGENSQTDLTFQQISRLITSYQSTLTTVDLYQIQGTGFTGDGLQGRSRDFLPSNL